MAWKIIGFLEGRAGALTILPDWATGEPNDFADHLLAVRARDQMNAAAAIEQKEQKLLRYIVVPAVDSGLHEAIRMQGEPTQRQAPPPPMGRAWQHGTQQVPELPK